MQLVLGCVEKLSQNERKIEKGLAESRERWGIVDGFD